MLARTHRTIALAVTLIASSAPATALAQTEDPADRTRFRWAVHYMVGPWFVPHRTGGATGVGVQLGAQLNDTIGVFYSGTFATGFASSYDLDRGRVGSSFGVWMYNAAMVDVTLERLVQVGIGPSVDTLAFGTAEVEGTSGGAGGRLTGLAGTYFGVQTRVGITLGGRRKRGKSGRFMLGIEAHPTFGNGPSVSTMLTIGGGIF